MKWRRLGGVLRAGTEAEKGRGAEWRERERREQFLGQLRGRGRSFQQAHLPGRGLAPLPRHAPTLAGAVYVLKGGAHPLEPGHRRGQRGYQSSHSPRVQNGCPRAHFFFFFYLNLALEGV